MGHPQLCNPGAAGKPESFETDWARPKMAHMECGEETVTITVFSNGNGSLAALSDRAHKQRSEAPGAGQ